MIDVFGILDKLTDHIVWVHKSLVVFFQVLCMMLIHSSYNIPLGWMTVIGRNNFSALTVLVVFELFKRMRIKGAVLNFEYCH